MSSRRNHLFSFVNCYGEKMYAIVAGARNIKEASGCVPPVFNKYEGKVNGTPAALAADVFHVS